MALLPEKGTRAKRSIAFHLSLLVAIVAAPLISVTAGVLLWSAALSREAAYRSLQQTARSLGNEVNREMANWASSLDTLAAMPTLDCRDLSRFYPAALDVARQHDAWLVVSDAQGQQLLNTLRPFGAPLPRIDISRGPLRDALKLDRPAVSDVFRGPVAGRGVVFVGRPVIRADRPLCWVAFGLWPERFNVLVRGMPAGESRVAMLVDGSGVIVADSRRLAFSGMGAPAWFVEASRRHPSGVLTGAWDGLGEAFVAYQRVNAGRWTMAVAARRSVLLSAWAVPVLAAALGIVLILAASLFTARLWGVRIRGEVARLVELARQLGGEQPIAPPKPPRVAEMAVLAKVLLRADRSLREGRAEQERRAAAEAERIAAESASRAKDRFLGLVSHELRTPLSAVLGWLEVAGSCDSDNVLLRKAIETAKRNARQQQRIIEDLIDVSRIMSGKFMVQKVPLELATLVHEALDDCRPAAAEKGVALAARVHSRGLVAADAGRMHQVLGNLIGNAIKFNTAGGWVLVTLEEQAGEVEIAVADNGVGLERRALARVFEQFWQASRPESDRSHGLGLGLALVRHIVELHGGRVAAHSDGPGHGARFSVQLPALRPSIAPPAPPAEAQPAA